MIWAGDHSPALFASRYLSVGCRADFPWTVPHFVRRLSAGCPTDSPQIIQEREVLARHGLPLGLSRSKREKGTGVPAPCCPASKGDQIWFPFWASCEFRTIGHKRQRKGPAPPLSAFRISRPSEGPFVFRGGLPLSGSLRCFLAASFRFLGRFPLDVRLEIAVHSKNGGKHG